MGYAMANNTRCRAVCGLGVGLGLVLLGLGLFVTDLLR